MADIRPQVQEKFKEVMESDRGTADVQRAAGNYTAGYGAGVEDKPTRCEVVMWYFYELCSYFVHTVLIPIVLPLIISQTVARPPAPHQGWSVSYKGFKCKQSEMQLYEGLVHGSVKLGHKSFSPLEWTSISWIVGLILSAPLLGVVSILLDYSHAQHLIAGAATGIGALFCLPAGFVRKPWIFPPYIIAIVTANTIATAAHARHLGLMIRGFTGATIPKRHFPNRRSFASSLSLYSTAAGCLGAAVFSSFTYRMLSHSDHFTALWVVSIFSGLAWALGLIQIFSTTRATACFTDLESNSAPLTHVVSIFKYPHAAASLAAAFLASFTTMCVFAAGLLYAVGYLCGKTNTVLFLWLLYFLIPVAALPLAHPLQQVLKMDAAKMQLLGFILSTLAAGFGFYYKGHVWGRSNLLLFAAIQGIATGLLHAFGRVVSVDCSPAGKEGVFSVWFAWARAIGSGVGFAVATGVRGNAGRAFGGAFIGGIIGIVVMVFGNISSIGGAEAAGHVMKSDEQEMDDHHSKGTCRQA